MAETDLASVAAAMLASHETRIQVLDEVSRGITANLVPAVTTVTTVVEGMRVTLGSVSEEVSGMRNDINKWISDHDRRIAELERIYRETTTIRDSRRRFFYKILQGVLIAAVLALGATLYGVIRFR